MEEDEEFLTCNNFEHVYNKKIIYEELSPLFRNKELLYENIFLDSIVSIYEYIVKYSSDIAFLDGLEEVLSYYNNAFSIDPYTTLQIMVKKHDDFVERENMMCSLKQKSIDNEDDLYDKIIYYFDYIGNTLEISVKGIIYELNALILIMKNKDADYEKICSFDFGVAIANILDQNYLKDILCIEPLKIKLSDWRNIAKHHSYRINNNIITCVYGKAQNSFDICFEDFLDYTYKITRSSNILNIARCIFVYDNLDALSHLPRRDINLVYFRDKIIFEQITKSLRLQGFILGKIEKKELTLDVEITDLLYSNNCVDEFLRRRENSYIRIFKDKFPLLKISRINIKYFDKYGNIRDVLWLEPKMNGNIL